MFLFVTSKEDIQFYVYGWGKGYCEPHDEIYILESCKLKYMPGKQAQERSNAESYSWIRKK